MKLGSPNTAQNFLVYLEKNPIAETLFKDVTGFNLPRLSLTRSRNEFFDTLTQELSNTSITLAGTLALTPIFKQLAAIASKVPISAFNGEINPAQQKLTNAAVKYARLGSSLAYLNFWGSLYWAAPFFRNWLTLTRTKSSNFEHLIGLAKPKDAVNLNQLQEDKRWQLKKMATVIATGLGLASASLVGFSAAARMAAKTSQHVPSPMIEWLFHHFDLKGPRSNQAAPLWATFMYWSLPAYFGYLHASRSKNEFKENMVKTLNSNLWFFFMQPTISKAFLKAYQKIDPMIQKQVPSFESLLTMADSPTRQKLLKLKNTEFTLGLGITVTMLAATPQILNIALTRKRFEKQEQEKLMAKLHENHQTLERKTYPFDTFMPTIS